MAWTLRGLNPGGGEIFLTGPVAHPASHTVGTGSFLGVKWLGHGIDRPPPSSAEVKESVELYLYSPHWTFMACSRVTFTFYTMCFYPTSMKCQGYRKSIVILLPPQCLHGLLQGTVYRTLT